MNGFKYGQKYRLSRVGLGVAMASTAFPGWSEEPPTSLPEVTVTGQALPADDIYVIEADETGITGPDSAELLRRVPGANVNRNGPLSGITQYRGMFGTRMNVMVDGMYLSPGGPNWMDPPLHYAPAAQLQSLEVVRGITPVRVSGESIGGHVRANLKKGEFGASEDPEVHAEISASGQTVDDGYAGDGLFSVANRNHRAFLSASREDGDDYDFSGGQVTPTEYERDYFGVGYGYRWRGQEVGLEFRRNETGHTGTPALPMDIDYFNTSMLRGSYSGTIGEVQTTASVFYDDVGHKMTNYQLREPANPMMLRYALAESNGGGYALSNEVPVGDADLAFGVDGQLSTHNTDIKDPTNPAFFVENFNNVDRNRHGAFAEWKAPLVNGWSTEIGVRYNRVYSNAGDVDGTPAQMMPGPRILRDQFNAADRSKVDNNFDWVAKLFYDLTPNARLEIGAARKMRAPSYQERYLWLPLESTAGLADGNRYVGDIDLDSEVSHQLELGLDWRTELYYLSPRAYYRRVNDYIQGTPATDPVVIAVSTASGDPNPLQFSNVDAKLYGFDADFGLALGRYWSIDGVMSYVRGKRRDINDNLYRIAPPNAILGLSHTRESWGVTLEGEFYADHDKVSETNEEQKTDGFALLNLRGEYRLGSDWRLRAGVNNLFDTNYDIPIGGINRVVGSDVKVGEPLPGQGRSFFASASIAW
jgi:iron complex outermembrane receptor protein